MGSPSFLGAVGREAGVEVLILIPKETFKTCNFPGGGGGGGSGSPGLHLSMDSEIKRIGRNDKYS